MNQSDSRKEAIYTVVPKRSSPARRAAFLGLAVLCGAASAAELRGQAHVAADFAALTSGQNGNTTGIPGTPGSVVAFGRDAFPVLEDNNGELRSAMAAGRAGTGTGSARGVAYSHTGFFLNNTGVKGVLFDNAVLWASRKANRANVTVGLGPGFNANFFANRGYVVKNVTTAMMTTTDDLTGCDVFVVNWGGYSSNAISKTIAFTAAGGGVVCLATPWALPAADLATANLVLDPFGLVYSGSYVSGTFLSVPTTNWPAHHSAIPAAERLLLDKQGGATLTLAEKDEATKPVSYAYEARGDIAALNAIVEPLSQLYGLITPTDTNPLVRNAAPVESMLARYQSRQFDVLPPGQLFVHPGTTNYPGLPGPGPLVAKTITINGNTPTTTYVSYRHQPFRFETGLYAQPGTAFTVTIPAALTNAGLQVHIGATEDTMFDINIRRSFPKIWRRSPLVSTTTQVGHVFGGLITILVPPNVSLGSFQVTVGNALAAPSFVLGENTDAEWNATLRQHPGAWGSIVTPSLTIYVPAVQLAELRNPTEVAQHWQRVMDTADNYYGYGPYRRRGEAIMVNPQLGLPGAGAYAAYPNEMGYGSGRDEVFLNSALRFGDWGAYHELGHNFQDNFQSEFIIATHYEVDVNLLPGMIYTLLHDVGPWDASNNRLNGTYEALERLTARTNFFALAPASQTWDAACNGLMAYDFYFNLSEAFGWQVYSNALGRLMRWLQGSPDAELTALDSGDANYRRNRLYLLFCDAAQRNLDVYFQRYGLGVTGRGYEITAAVKTQIANKGYAVWSDNTPLSNLSNPGTLNVAENLAPGTALHTFTVTEPDPGEILTWQITAGNGDGAFSIDRHAGVLRVGAAGLDRERAASYSLTVMVQGHGIPLSGVRPTASRTFGVNVLNLPDSPTVTLNMFTATNSMMPGTVLGNCTALIEPGRTLSKWEIVLGNHTGLFAINTAGQLSLSLPGSLPNPGLAELTVRATDSAGGEGYGLVKVLCNTTPGLFEQRWAGQHVFTGVPNYTGRLTNSSTPQNVAESFSRRVSGWLIPPVSGDYTFWVAADDLATFYFSTNSTEALKRPFAKVWTYTGFASWDDLRSQKSQTFALQAGRAYYLEGTQTDGNGGDFLNIAWSGPGIARQTIPGSALVPALGGVAFTAQSPFASWQAVQFGVNAANPAIAGPNADPDGDGLSNLAEHALGLNPLAGSILPWRTALTNVSGQNYLGVTVNRSAAATDVVIDAQVADSLTPAAWNPGSVLTLLNTATTFSVRDVMPAGAATNRFLRLRFTRP